MEHVGLYVGLAVYTLAGAKVHVQKFLHPQLGSPSHINHHIHHHSLLSDISSYRKSCWAGEVGGVSGELPIFKIRILLCCIFLLSIWWSTWHLPTHYLDHWALYFCIRQYQDYDLSGNNQVIIIENWNCRQNSHFSIQYSLPWPSSHHLSSMNRIH